MRGLAIIGVMAFIVFMLIHDPGVTPGNAKGTSYGDLPKMEDVLSPQQEITATSLAALTAAIKAQYEALAQSGNTVAPSGTIITPDGASIGQTVIDVPNVGEPRDMTLRRAPSLSAQGIDAILDGYGSPAAGNGHVFIDFGRKYHIDPAYAVAFFIQESTAGTACKGPPGNPNDWAGCKNGADLTNTTHNLGNIICTDGWTAAGNACYGRFRDYPDWPSGIEDWFRLINDEYIEGDICVPTIGHRCLTVDDVIPVYAPSFENNVGGYKSTVAKLVGDWRTAQSAPVIEQIKGAAKEPAKGKIEVIPGMQMNAVFDSVNCGYWAGQGGIDGCQHFGDDIAGPDGTEVRNAYDCTAITVEGAIEPGVNVGLSRNPGQHWMCVGQDPETGDTLEWYYGHLQNAKVYHGGEFIAAGTVIGQTCCGLNHTHWQL